MTARMDERGLSRLGRRKACDLCFTKKIKCDMLQPACSNCILYKAVCTSGKPRRRTEQAAKVKAVQQPAKSTNGDKTEERLARIERQLDQLIGLQATALPIHAPGSWSHSASSQVDIGDNAIRLGDVDSNVLFMPRDPMPLDSGPGVSLDVDFTPKDELPLPPLADIMPVVEHYFETFSPIIPLFEKSSFMHMLEQWYIDPSTHHKAAWAAIQVVLAIALRSPTPGILLGSEGTDRHHRANFFLKNAQSVVSDLVTRDKDLLGIQVLLGIVILFQNSSDASPASVIIGTAIRLAHRMRLNSKLHERYYSPEENLRRQRLFWVAYILDKDISLRIQVPSVQVDTDIDIEIPPASPQDDIGVLFTHDRSSSFHYHRSMIHLAQIQGKVYEQLYSNSAGKTSRQVRQARVQQLDRMLSHWYNSIPTAFRIGNVDSSIGDIGQIQMTKMYHTYLLVLVMTYGIYSHDANWVQAIRSGDRGAIKDLTLGNYPEQLDGLPEKQVMILPGSWYKLVDVSRGCLRMFGECMMILLTNIFVNPGHPSASADEVLSAKAIQLFDRVVEFIPDSDNYIEIRLIIGEFYERTVHVLNEANMHGGSGPALDILQANLFSVQDGNDGSWSWATAVLPESR
ncbi:hypothetical protein QQS21_001688 [Conoideocrella luteorostrata]|uniref:Zn(2)-C6 fungal-type domain-containing protein n=1 Tax=Conoideocrella luteorostrata TaxID=1105319 RepID=A0AAJ0D0A3_9HYPO|nr:hypothetical protein QQS21_001688 [Conoideocrella luteorostrata]